jgi:hypothetical protein
MSEKINWLTVYLILWLVETDFFNAPESERVAPDAVEGLCAETAASIF